MSRPDRRTALALALASFGLGAGALGHPGAVVAATGPGAGTTGATPLNGAPGHGGGDSVATVDDWYQRVRTAASSHSFLGHYVVTGEGVASSARIAHYGQGRESYERIESLDGAPRVVLRHNDTVHTVWPEKRTMVVEQRSALGAFPSLGAAGAAAPRLEDHYRVASLARGRVAGRDADIVTIAPRDDLRFGHRLWVDHATRLLLRADVLGPRDEVLASSAFIDLTLPVKPQPAAVLAAMKATGAGWKTVQPTLLPVQLAAEGWRIDPLPPGFRLISCVRRSLVDKAAVPAAVAAAVNGSPPTALQAVYTDGLASVSVFLEDVGEAANRPIGQMQTGPVSTVMQRRSRHQVTVVGELPPAAARRIADAVQRA